MRLRQPDRRLTAALALLALAAAVGAGSASDQPQGEKPRTKASAPAGASAGSGAGVAGFDLDALTRQANVALRSARTWYDRTHPADRVTWGGLGASAALGLMVLLERMFKLRRRKIMPEDFRSRFLERLQDGRLDRGKAMDFCELNPSPASRVALAAVKRWGRPTTDLDRAVGLAQRVEADRLRRNVGTLRRIAAMTPLIGLLGSLFSAGRTLSGLSSLTNANAGVWGPALAQALVPLTAGVALAIVALVLYDGLATRVESLAGALEQTGAETIDAIAMALPIEPRVMIGPMGSGASPSPTSGSSTSARTPHQIRLEVPKPGTRIRIDDEEDYL